MLGPFAQHYQRRAIMTSLLCDVTVLFTRLPSCDITVRLTVITASQNRWQCLECPLCQVADSEKQKLVVLLSAVMVHKPTEKRHLSLFKVTRVSKC